MSHDSLNQVEDWRSFTVAPLTTSKQQAERGPSAIPIGAGAAGLERDSVALCQQITTLDDRKVGERIGLLSDQTLRAVNEGLVVPLDLLR